MANTLQSDDTPVKSVRTIVSLPHADYQQIEAIAEQKKVSIAWVVREAVDEYLSQVSPLFRR